MRLLLLVSVVICSQAFAQPAYENVKQKDGYATGIKAPVKTVKAPVKAPVKSPRPAKK